MSDKPKQATPVSAPAYDPLMAFATWYVHQPGFGVPRSLYDGLSKVGDATGIVLFRQAPFQVQLWICAPGMVVGEHSHPHVDGIGVYISGDLNVCIHGKTVVDETMLVEREDGTVNTNGMMWRIPPGAPHSFSVGPRGGAFLVVQNWLNGEPKSVELDWQGDAIDETHEIAIKQYRERPSA